MVLITLLSVLILSTLAQSRYILANYSIPDSKHGRYGESNVNTLTPFPIDQCVIYKVEISVSDWIVESKLSKIYYGKFECTTTSTTDDTVIFTDYGQDSTCMTQNNTNDYTYYPKAESGNEGDFSCSGSDDHVSIQTWLIGGLGDDNGGAACCDDYIAAITVVTSKYATEVCFDSGNGYYSMAECNATQTKTLYFSDSACTTTITPSTDDSGFSIGLMDASSSYCQLLDRNASPLLYTIYGIMSECVIDGTVRNIDDYCPYIAPTSAPTTAQPTTSDPTSNPTAPTIVDPTTDPSFYPTNEPSTDPTNDPTSSPTQEPTTYAPSIKVDEAGGEFYFVKHLIILVLYMAVG